MWQRDRRYPDPAELQLARLPPGQCRLDPEEHVPVYRSTFLVFLFPTVVLHVTERTVWRAKDSHDPVESLFCSHDTDVKMPSHCLSVCNISGKVAVLFSSGFCTPATSYGTLHMWPSVLGHQGNKEVWKATVVTSWIELLTLVWFLHSRI